MKTMWIAAALALVTATAFADQYTPQQFEAGRAAILKQCEVDYPDMKDGNSLFFRTAARLAKEAFSPTNPNHSAGLALDAPRFFCDEAARTLGLPVVHQGKIIAPVARAAAPAKATPAPAEPETGGTYGLIGIPSLDAHTDAARRRIDITQSQYTRTEKDERSMSVSISGKFFSPPSIKYQVQCFFIGRNEANHQRMISDAIVGDSNSQIISWEFESGELAGGSRKFTSVPFSGTLSFSDGSVGAYSGVDSSRTTTTGVRMEGWIVRVVARGEVLLVKSNQQNLLSLAGPLSAQLDAAAAKAPHYPGH